MMTILKTISAAGVLGAGAWFFMQPSVDFPAVLLAILSLTIFMMTLLPIRAE